VPSRLSFCCEACQQCIVTGFISTCRYRCDYDCMHSSNQTCLELVFDLLPSQSSLADNVCLNASQPRHLQTFHLGHMAPHTHTHTHTLMDKIKCKPCASPMQDRTPASPVPQAGNDLPPESFCHSKQSALSIEKAAKRSWFTGRLLLGLSEMAPCHETQAGSSRARPGDHSSLELRLCRACTGRQDHHPAHCPAPLHTHHTIQSGPVSYFDYRYDYTCSAFV